ncbi:MAG: hypothetical protein AB1585_18240 [Thermodesulfobacteriota bacterium]
MSNPMEKMEGKIIDLVDVISEPDLSKSWKKAGQDQEISPRPTFAEVQTRELESLVRSEVERLIRRIAEENIQKMIREILVQEIEKAVAREMEKLKRT